MGGVTNFTVNGAAEASITQGQCATIRWDVQGVEGLYYQGQGVTGQGERQECPTQTTTYELRVAHRDGSQTTHTVRINVSGGGQQAAIMLWVNGRFADDSNDATYGRIDLCGIETSNLSWQVTNAGEVGLREYCVDQYDCENAWALDSSAGYRTYQRTDVVGRNSLFVFTAWQNLNRITAGVNLDFTCD